MVTHKKISTSSSSSSSSGHAEQTTKIFHYDKIRLYLSLTIGSLGIIFGDIGTSPLYVIRTIFAENPNPSREQCIGAVSLIIWNLIIVLIFDRFAIDLLN